MRWARASAALLASASVLGSSCSFGDSRPDSGVTVVTDAMVYTLDPDRPWAEAFAYDARGVIVAVGGEDDVREAAEGDPTVIDARGNMVLPGFQDTHVHVPEAGVNESLCFLPPGATLRRYGELAAACADEQPGSDWVRGAGASLFELRDTGELPVDVLDRAVPDRPALILDDLGHAAWTNSLGLRAAGISRDDPDPQGGIFHRDPDSGRLTGLLLEDAQQRVRNAAALDDDAVYQGLLAAMRELSRNGITTASDAGGYWGQSHPNAWLRARDEGRLTVRAFNSLYVYPSLDVDQQLAEFAELFSDDPDSLLQFDTAKIYVDGILDLGTAAMLEPYDRPVDPNLPSGFFYFRPDHLRNYVSELHMMGYRMEFHVIGDAATRAALDAIEAIDDDPTKVAARRHRTTHTYLVHPDDIDRFTELGVVADFQVGPEAVDPGYHEYLSRFIGGRAFDLIPVKRLLQAHAHVSLSSDWDADPLSPFGTIERALTRETNAVTSLKTAIALVTIDAAYALGQDDTSGSLEVGKYADYTIIDQNLFEIDTDEIDQTEVLLTVLAGRETYRAPLFEAPDRSGSRTSSDPATP
jgi:hypothetical protein